jgi:uncharacterized membrane protein YfcA
MDTADLVFLIIGALAGGFVNGLAGFGTSLFALGWWLQIMAPVQAVALVLAMSVFSGLPGAWVVRHSIEPARLARFLLPALLGIPLGLYLLEWVDARTLKIVIAVFLLVYAAFFLTRSELPELSRPTPIVDAIIGFVGGALGSMAGLSGALPTMWLTLRDWTKAQTRAVLQPYNVIVLGISAGLLVWQGAYDRTVLIAMAIALPATMLAATLGIWTFKRLTDHQFRLLLIGLMLVSGLALLSREVL